MIRNVGMWGILIGLAAPAMAQTTPDVTGSIGIAGVVKPTYAGAESYEALVLPTVQVSYRDTFFLNAATGTPTAGWNVLNTGALKAGPMVRYRAGRKEDDADALRGMGDIDAAAEVGAFVDYRAGNWKLGADLAQSTSADHGVRGNVKADYRMHPLGTETLTLTAGPRLAWTNDHATQLMYGVDARQSARSGYAPYRAEGGLASYGAAGALVYSLTPVWAATAMASYNRLAGDAADSPLVANGRGNADQFAAGVGLSYRFGL